MGIKYTKLRSGAVSGAALAYWLVESRVTVDTGTFTRYGVRIEKAGGEAAEVRDIFGDRERAAGFIDTLCRCTVTPVALMDVVNDRLYQEEMAVR